MRALRAIASLTILISVSLHSQTQATPQFEVASVKPFNPDQSNAPSGGKSGHGRLTMSNVTLKRCIMGAYGVGPSQIQGGPSWLDSDRYEIVAKSEQPDDGDAVLMTMLQSLLAERFKLTIHRESKLIDAFVLEVAKNGPKLERADAGESATSNARGLIDAKVMTMDRFAEVLSRQMDRPVVNHTRLEGIFNLKLEWAPETSAPDPADTRTSIFSAIQDQIGLRLRAQKTSIEVLMIEHAEKPSAN
jgi:uncharacterized protein (TIGR03435 family)